MTRTQILIPVGALVMALGFGGLVEAGQRDEHGRDRNGRASQGQVQGRSGGQQAQGREQGQQNQQQAQQAPPERQQAPVPSAPNRQAMPAPGPQVAPTPGRSSNGARDNRAQRREVVPAPQANSGGPGYSRDSRGYDRNDRGYNDRGHSDRDHSDRGSNDRRGYGSDRRYDNRTPYPVYGYGRPAPRHYYGPGGHFSVYFGWGSGYLYGAPYAGRVYGYVGRPVYAARAYYGDVRLLVEPRDAQVYVDGYYAGIVNDFDGVYQRLTLTVGPHQIEIDAPGLEPRVFDVYIDPARIVDLRADLFR